MLEAVYQPERKAWREPIGEALAASRHLLTVIASSADAADSASIAQRIESMNLRAVEPRRRIVDAMNTMLHRLVPIGHDEEILLLDAGAVREAAIALGAADGAEDGESVRSGGSRAPKPLDPATGTRPPCILVADDEQQVRELLRRVLTKLGYGVLLAENGRAALDVVEGRSIDLILTDINMPLMDGMALLRLLKSNAATRDIPVIVISSQDDLKSVAQCIEAGAEDHIGKPYEPIVLQARIRASLERKRVRDLELDYFRSVAQITAAAEAVETETYLPGSLHSLSSQGGQLGGLARVFDRMVTSLKSREERLQRRLRQLRAEMGDSITQPGIASFSPDSPFRTGAMLAGRYEILGLLGRGGMGIVYHARDLELGEEVAIKVVRADLLTVDPTLLARLKSEIRFARKISHKNAVRSHDLGEWKGTYFITMEYVRGITVAELLDKRGRLSVGSTLAIGAQLLDALVVAHEQQIIHRDIKPANLLIDGAGTLKVMDFGLARPVLQEARLTMGGLIVGTPEYMAPEQLMGGGVDTRSDLYSVGVVLYECLAGRPPYVADSPVALAALIVEREFPPLQGLCPAAPAALVTLINQLLELEPKDRPASASELAHKLSEIDHGEPESEFDRTFGGASSATTQSPGITAHELTVTP
jgi:CheY-like chemotaxis protein